MYRTLTLAAVLMLLILPAQAEKAAPAVPEQAVGTDTMLAAYIDVTQFDPAMIDGIGQVLLGLANNELLQDQGLTLPIGDPEQLSDSLTLLRGSFLQSGGEGLMITVEMPGEDNWSPPMNLFAKTNDKPDAKAMAAIVRTMGEGEMDATIEPLGNGWHNIAMTSKQGEAVTKELPEPDAEVYAALSQELAKHDKPIFAAAFRMQEGLREMLDELEDEAKNAQPRAGEGGGGQAQMLTGLALGMFKPIRQLDTIGLAVSEDGEESMLVDVQMSFLDEVSAQQFGNAYNTIMMFAPLLMAQAGQGGEIENMPDAATINQFFMKLRMTPDGKSLKLKLDQDFFDLAEKLAPLFEGFAEQQGGGLQL